MPITDYLPTNTWPAASAKGDFLFTIYRLAVAIILAWQSEPEMMASPLHDIARHSPPFTKMWAQLEPLRMLATLTLRLAIFIRINGGLELLSSSKDCTAISQRIRGISSSPRPTPSPTSLIAISHIVERHRNVPGLDMVSPDPGGRRRLRILRLRGLRSVAVFADAESSGLLVRCPAFSVIPTIKGAAFLGVAKASGEELLPQSCSEYTSTSLPERVQWRGPVLDI
ncbi:hypothetical protein SISNIDRAFT_490905 [Sistotremastrum niveocremeum HHB9708]|uniref:Uncharacterized protein n=1 Tax=Sistotremastrum niveocremeum HHB9708 TaxID=1314777 RepID=A0A164NFY9_9AGAM|nr:hypothetical protein SISNIDRAFT_490905 [Sistotremastrum niveocremeum HHB9708]